MLWGVAVEYLLASASCFRFFRYCLAACASWTPLDSKMKKFMDEHVPLGKESILGDLFSGFFLALASLLPLGPSLFAHPHSSCSSPPCPTRTSRQRLYGVLLLGRRSGIPAQNGNRHFLHNSPARFRSTDTYIFSRAYCQYPLINLITRPCRGAGSITAGSTLTGHPLLCLFQLFFLCSFPLAPTPLVPLSFAPMLPTLLLVFSQLVMLSHPSPASLPPSPPWPPWPPLLRSYLSLPSPLLVCQAGAGRQHPTTDAERRAVRPVSLRLHV